MNSLKHSAQPFCGVTPLNTKFHFRTPSPTLCLTARSSSTGLYRISGFTLFELIVTIAIIAIIAVMAAPSFANMYSKQKLESSAREVAMKISEARAQAAMLRNTTGMCLSSLSEESCLTALGITDLNKNRVFIAQLETGVTVDSRSETHLIFRNNGSITTATNFILLRKGLSYCVAVGLTGDTRINEGACT
ncbi:prepilin-type N-terminal cleavage/methylation domain-containing protein [Acinetobacter suaedae]|uniref:Prepilin-type N-terminal cleavage/methylation domain-containing protein n=1 Tax=Acinetobacter suaedae TaxID=2609668 RepID=A0A5P1UZM6_9GAMM|nr:prepilin-type N-terminal cleavage/methylation domain-containing protein [Acinetobacter sp. C16S1]